ncbi:MULTISPECIES: hypothetical protein [unclassified Variovorax]|uniref:hypothetical protein n=1 Tax=unclassified Variovorax TaxID=663243 RepID=UPI001BD51E9F|nr:MULTISPECIES: hypothetical protein [unclassified Variovorax]
MDHDSDSIRLRYHGWDVRSNLMQSSLDGMVAAGAMLYFDEACKCHLVSCRQFANAGVAIQAIQLKATQWIDAREATAEEVAHVEPTFLS